MAHHAAGDPRRAVQLYRTALADSERILGHTHPMTEHLRVNLRVAEGGEVGNHGGGSVTYTLIVDMD